MYKLCFEKHGNYTAAFAIAHSQIDDRDPLRFFVTADRTIIINPIVTRHSGYTNESEEGCMTHPNLPPRKIARYHKIEGTYQSVMIDPENKDKFKLSSVMLFKHGSMVSKIWQHEISHLNGHYVYDEDFDPSFIEQK
jgi:peptide deformylase